MATRNLKSQSVGDIKVQSGTGYPNHFATRGSTYTDIVSGKIYKNIDNTDNGWVLHQEAPESFNLDNQPFVLPKINDKEMFLFKNVEPGTIAFNIDRHSIVLFNSFKWVSLFDEELHPILFKDNFNKAKFESQWSVINGKEKNFWTIGKSEIKTGISSVYITNNGNSNTFNSKESNVHLFFDIFIPKEIKDLRLYLEYKCGAEKETGFGIISIAPVTYFPEAGKMVNEEFIKNAIYKTDSWQKAYSSLGKELSGQNARIIISWHNEINKNEDVESLTIDNLSLEYIK